MGIRGEPHDCYGIPHDWDAMSRIWLCAKRWDLEHPTWEQWRGEWGLDVGEHWLTAMGRKINIMPLTEHPQTLVDGEKALREALRPHGIPLIDCKGWIADDTL